MNLKSKIFRYYNAQKTIDFNTETIIKINNILIDSHEILIITIKALQNYESKLHLLITNSIKGNITQEETNLYNKNIQLKTKLNNVIEPNEQLINTLKEEIIKATATITELEKDDYMMNIIKLEKEIKKYALYGSIKYSQDNVDNKFDIYIKSHTDITFILNINESYTIEYVKYLLSNQSGVPIHETRLIYNGSELHNNKIINDYKITPKSIIHMILSSGITCLL